MDYSKTMLLDTIAKIAPNRYLQIFIILVFFALAAKLVDIILTRFFMRLLKKTKFTLDDQILEIFHRPIFVSIILFGLALATERFDFPQTVSFVTLSGLKTVAILLWAQAAARFMKLIVGIVSLDERRFTLIQDRTLTGTHKLPYLSDIPFIGFFFRGKAKEVKQSSLLIFVTPEIIDSTGARFFDVGGMSQ